MTEAGLFDGQAVGLADMLERREHRVRLREAALARFVRPCVSLGIVMPGPVKLCPLTREIAGDARRAVLAVFAARGWVHETIHAEDLPTGPEALFSVAADAEGLKREMVALEESHLLGRLWDLDVHDPAGNAVSRRGLGLPVRRCLVCDAPAHGCARAQAHPLEELHAAMAERLHMWRKAPGVASGPAPGKP